MFSINYVSLILKLLNLAFVFFFLSNFFFRINFDLD